MSHLISETKDKNGMPNVAALNDNDQVEELKKQLQDMKKELNEMRKENHQIAWCFTRM
jgi:regulator of replication initiation timing